MDVFLQPRINLKVEDEAFGVVRLEIWDLTTSGSSASTSLTKKKLTPISLFTTEKKRQDKKARTTTITLDRTLL